MVEQVAIVGLKELTETMKDLPVRVQRRLLGNAVSKGSQEVKRKVKDVARTEAYDTGTLFRNIRTKRGKRPKKTIVRYMVGVEHGKVRPVDAAGTVLGRKGKRRKATRREKAGEDPYYYHFVELGTARGIKAVNYMSRGIDAAETKAVKAMQQELKKRIEREYAKGKVRRA